MWPHHFEFNFSILLGLGVLVAFDLILRYLLFGQLESAAIDAALFATAYSIVEANRVLVDAVGREFNESDLDWLRRAIVCAVCLTLLAFLHSLLDKRLRLHVEQLYDDVYEKLDTDEDTPGLPERRQLMRAAKPFVMRSVLLTFVGTDNGFGSQLRLREGKRDWRGEAAELIRLIDSRESKAIETPEGEAGNREAASGETQITADKLLLSARLRNSGLAAFALLGLISVLAPAVTL